MAFSTDKVFAMSAAPIDARCLVYCTHHATVHDSHNHLHASCHVSNAGTGHRLDAPHAIGHLLTRHHRHLQTPEVARFMRRIHRIA
jgi:hypothetical protein